MVVRLCRLPCSRLFRLHSRSAAWCRPSRMWSLRLVWREVPRTAQPAACRHDACIAITRACCAICRGRDARPPSGSPHGDSDASIPYVPGRPLPKSWVRLHQRRRVERPGSAISQRHVAFALGGEAAARLAERLAIPISPDTLLRMAAKPVAAETHRRPQGSRRGRLGVAARASLRHHPRRSRAQRSRRTPARPPGRDTRSVAASVPRNRDRRPRPCGRVFRRNPSGCPRRDPGVRSLAPAAQPRRRRSRPGRPTSWRHSTRCQAAQRVPCRASHQCRHPLDDHPQDDDRPTPQPGCLWSPPWPV